MKICTKHFDNIEYTARYWLINEAVMGFKTYKIISETTETPTEPGIYKNTIKRVYERDNADHGMDVVTDLEEAQIFLSGNIRFDGCSNMQFNEQENCMLHFCGRKMATDVRVLMGELYDIAIDYIPSTDKDCFK